MFELANLKSYNVDVDFSKCFPTKDSQLLHQEEMLNRINLTALKNVTFEDLRIALDQISKYVPNLEYVKNIGNTQIRLGLFEYTIFKLRISKGELVVNIKYPDSEKKSHKEFTFETLQNIDKDFNFLLGHMFGFITKSNEQPNAKIRLTFTKKGMYLPSEKLKVVCKDVAEILSNPKTTINGFELYYFDKQDKKHTLEFSQSEDSFSYKDSYESKVEGTLNLRKIFENSLKLSSEVCNKLCEC